MHSMLLPKDLLGPEVILSKRSSDGDSSTQPLTPTTKAKQPKKGQFTLKRKKSKSEFDFEDLICPLEAK